LAQQGSPPRGSSGLPESGRTGRHGRHGLPDQETGPEPQQDWPPEADRPVTGRRARPDQPPGPDWPSRPNQPPGSDWAARPGQASRPEPASRPGRSDRGARRQDDPFTESDEGDLPPWAGLSIYPTRPGGSRVRPPALEPEELAEPGEPGSDGGPVPGSRRRRGRAAATRLRRSRRRVYVYCGTAIVVAIIAAAAVAIHGLHKPTPSTGFVRTLQAGEFKSVPGACGSVSQALLTQNLPGTAAKVTTAGVSAASSQCTFTVDKKPVFRVLDVTLQAYQPSAFTGNGSATSSASDAFLLAQSQLAHPAKKSPLPPATIVPLTGLGKQAFSALQVIHNGRIITDLVTVLARDHNLVVTVSLQAQASGRGFGPVAPASLRAGAQAVSRAVLAKATSEPTVSG
jgi:hypothetical protein